MRKILTLLILLISAIYCKSQQESHFSHYMFNQVTFNPGYAGSSGDINATVINRQQWVGFEGNPQTTSLAIETGMTIFGINSGLGLIIMDDQIGFNRDFTAKACYAYRKNIGSGILSLGINIGVFNSALESPSFNDVTDPILPKQNDRKLMFNMDFGAFYFNESYYVGISSTKLNQPEASYPSGGRLFYKRHYYLTAGYDIPSPWPLFEFMPSVFISSDGASTQLNVNGMIKYNKKIWGGVTYRMNDAIVIMAGFEMLNGLQIGYSYDLITSKIRTQSSGSHEVMIRYSFNFDFSKTPEKYKSVRYL